MTAMETARKETWAEFSNYSLIHDAKLTKSFDSARWNRGYNPDVAFVSTKIASMWQRGVLDPIPRTQHRPVRITIRSPVTAMHCRFRRRFNLKKANWSKFTKKKLTKPLHISLHTQITTMIVWTWWRKLHDTTSLGDARRSTSLVCQMSPQTYWNSTLRSTTKTHSLSLLSSSETPYWMIYMMKDVRSGETWWKTPTSPRRAKKNGQPYVVLGHTMSPPPRVTADQIANQLLSNQHHHEEQKSLGNHTSSWGRQCLPPPPCHCWPNR